LVTPRSRIIFSLCALIENGTSISASCRLRAVTTNSSTEVSAA